ncbi:MBL fold metallo-hydrolase [Parasulfitobacter algicola]|uniref:MBL fold metallo-hydrolase n=1 Tax=Parasulfitobacter algicola TaxID=2614809 RepID=A0ABX2ITX2_9RHOB|nr:MBL fold metallo-hydrolase [Sulfitobacter algicola]NSX53814.1 MBL fold metallo-hydrolase [Sulfitobacter algicola]
MNLLHKDKTFAPIRYPWDNPPAEGEAIEVAEGVLWLRLPLPMALDHVNCYALDDGDSWTIIDTGFASKRSRSIWEKLIQGPLAGKPIGRVIVTHHHPDHIGLAGWFMSEYNASLWTTRTSWLFARMLTLDEQDRPTSETIKFWRGAGMPADEIARREGERPFNFADAVDPLPLGYHRIRQGDCIRIGSRDWDVHIGHGHAPEHATFWSRDDNLILSGDQIIPSISSNIGVYATEPDADPLAEWLESCERLGALAHDDHLALGGHKLPFTGLRMRMHQLIENHHGALHRLQDHLAKPKTAHDCFPALFKRKIGGSEYGLALVEAVAHLNHLLNVGRVSRSKGDNGAWLWVRNA